MKTPKAVCIEFQPTTEEEFWCHSCDSVLVNSKDKDTGQFFAQGGHLYESNQKTDEREVGNFVRVIFAVCAECLKDCEA